MPFAKTTHGKIHYTIKGEGETVVLVRGLGRWSVHWFGWDDLLAQHCKVITFDNKGLGNTSSVMKPWHTISEIADDVAAILKTERIEAAHIAGTSLGGMIALEFALKYPKLTKSLSIISSSIGRSGHMRLSIPAIRILVSAPFKKEAIYTDLARMLTSPHTDQNIIKKLEHDWRTEDRKHKKPHFTVLGQLLAAMRFRQWESLANIAAPTQIIVGHDDQFVPRGNSLFLHEKMPKSELIELEKAGHEPHIDQPETLTKLVSGFAKRHSQSSI